MDEVTENLCYNLSLSLSLSLSLTLPVCLSLSVSLRAKHLLTSAPTKTPKAIPGLLRHPRPPA